MKNDSLLYLKNPHSVLAALKARPKDVLKVCCPKSSANGGAAWDQVLQLAKNSKIPVSFSEKNLEAVVRERQSVSIEEIFGEEIFGEEIFDKEMPGNQPATKTNGLWLALDCLQDPHNVGAIFRTAAFFGVKGIMLTQERSAPLSSTVYDVASGGMEAIPFAVLPNLQRGMEAAKAAGVWVLGSSEHAHDAIDSIPTDRPWCLILGNEERGLRRLTEERCDMLCSIPSRGKVGSLNVSVACGILISKLTNLSQ